MDRDAPEEMTLAEPPHPFQKLQTREIWLKGPRNIQEQAAAEDGTKYIWRTRILMTSDKLRLSQVVFYLFRVFALQTGALLILYLLHKEAAQWAAIIWIFVHSILFYALAFCACLISRHAAPYALSRAASAGIHTLVPIVFLVFVPDGYVADALGETASAIPVLFFEVALDSLLLSFPSALGFLGEGTSAFQEGGLWPRLYGAYLKFVITVSLIGWTIRQISDPLQTTLHDLTKTAFLRYCFACYMVSSTLYRLVERMGTDGKFTDPIEISQFIADPNRAQRGGA